MKDKDTLRARVERALTAPGEELDRWTRFVRFQIKLWRFCAKRLWENNVGAMSAALSFRTIFALVPAIVLALLVLKSVGAHENSKVALRKFMSASGFDQIVIHADAPPTDTAPADADAAEPADPRLSAADEPGDQADTAPVETVNLADQIEALVATAESKLTVQRIGPIGAILLIWTATSLLTTLERSLNRIFGAKESRSVGKRLIMYWAVITLGPIVLTAAAYLGGRASATIEGMGLLSWILVLVTWGGPAVVGILVIAAMYKLLPNTNVRYGAAVGGALIAVPLWMLARWGFSVYVTELVGTGNLYGALGVIPLFLVWLNLSWTILLFGAQLAHTATHLDSYEQEPHDADLTVNPPDLLAAAIAVADSYHAGDGPVPVELVAQKLHTTELASRELLDRLADAGLLCPIVEDEAVTAFVLARPADKISVLDVLGLAASSNGAPPADDIQQRVSDVQRHAADSLGHITLADALRRQTGNT